MRLLLIIVCCFWGFAVFGQNWEEDLNHARRLYKEGKYKEALKYYKRAGSSAPNDVDLSQEIGQTAYRANDFRTAAESFERQANNAKTKEKEIRARTSLGESCMKQQDYQSAVDAYKDVLRLDPDNEKARQRLMEAKRLLEQQKKQEQNQQDKEKEQKNNNQNQQQNKNNNKNPQQKGDKDQNQSKDNKQNQNAQSQKKDQQKLQDKETERKLDEFAKQELNTKRRINGSKGTTGGKKARKDW
ncbi:tetratricopeptide repeat protein [Fluviicola sp.]|jgi:Ca-activated chloride channel family protein|uniref:tetratricopeptide repeat protein n=1 Tax=Fluviicola sp. TaxID=1917219 RepID=UPI002817B2BA|nr:tetratricopeptide repeat protein [Fluviicola sp.]MDR0802329.1 tetratricopeptide repeat protein [Fluviicola sp.]